MSGLREWVLGSSLMLCSTVNFVRGELELEVGWILRACLGKDSPL